MKDMLEKMLMQNIRKETLKEKRPLRKSVLH
jgi:hypothetical protein